MVEEEGEKLQLLQTSQWAEASLTNVTSWLQELEGVQKKRKRAFVSVEFERFLESYDFARNTSHLPTKERIKKRHLFSSFTHKDKNSYC